MCGGGSAQKVTCLNRSVYIYICVMCHGRSPLPPKILTEQMAISQSGVTTAGLP